ncbi:MAG: Ribosomal RNA large subunit methyltransferase I [Chloroflexi bacterium]|nr:Ribosomal RNA large subunit methyltransferase I [Chloroflexota bacterium]
MTPSLFLKKGRQKPILRRHPWIFSGAVERLGGNPSAGETLAVRDIHGQFLAWAAYSPESQIRARIWSWEENQTVGEAFFQERLERSLARRSPLSRAGDDRQALRLVHGESDGLPGLIVDQYGQTLVMQILSAGAERWRETVAEILMDLTSAQSLYERSDVEVRNLEGLSPRTGLVRGVSPPERVAIEENGLTFEVDVRQGHKTGFYLDQRLNRANLREFTRGKEVLDCFSYTGGFAANALAGGANSVCLVDSSGEALQRAKENLAENAFSLEEVEFVEEDVFQALRLFRDQARAYDVIVLDPPKFAPTASHAKRAAKGYKDINLWAFKLLRPGGILVTFSCSGGISTSFFQKIVADAALDAEVNAQILERLSQSPDHPVVLNFPEGEYLKGLVVRKQ